MSCQAISKPRFRESGVNETRNLELETDLCCEQAWGKQDANLSGSEVFREVFVMMGEFLRSNLDSRLKKAERV